MAAPRPPVNPHATAAENERILEFIAHLEREGFSPATRACYLSDWWNIAERSHAATGRRFRIDRFGPDDFQLQRAELAARGVAPATLNRRLAFLRRYSAHAALKDRSVREVAAGYSSVPFQAVVRRATKALTHAQEERLRAAADRLGPVEAALVSLLLGTGLRSAETAALRRSDVAWEGDTPVSVRVRGEPAKTVVLPPRTRLRLATHVGTAPVRDDPPLFVGRGGAALGEDGVSAMVERVSREAGIEATPRTLRHTFAVRYLSEHRDDVEGLARALGQASLASARAYRNEAAAGDPGVRTVRWEALEEGPAGDGVRRRVFSGSRLEAERAVLRPGAGAPAHSHPEEQMTFVLSGRVSCEVDGKKVEAGAGEFLHVPGGATHAIRAEGDRAALVLTVFGPPRRSRDGAGL